MHSRRAVLKTGPSVNQLKRGPERTAESAADAVAAAKKDLDKLKKHYDKTDGAVLAKGMPTYEGATDSIFD